MLAVLLLWHKNEVQSKAKADFNQGMAPAPHFLPGGNGVLENCGALRTPFFGVFLPESKNNTTILEGPRKKTHKISRTYCGAVRHGEFGYHRNKSSAARPSRVDRLSVLELQLA